MIIFIFILLASNTANKQSIRVEASSYSTIKLRTEESLLYNHIQDSTHIIFSSKL